ncbi:hypothetical protein [Aeromicrobium sp.]|uniref:hypothetical protein n=1 Tax=Aeromicrobium sp. TaxID=1871063 RepID=UPI0019A80FA4|nr:hypothetical protein [Aeromicrobium sp.]MBC7632210.1 hypothetical protein [Aeromicrobium sp.]
MLIVVVALSFTSSDRSAGGAGIGRMLGPSPEPVTIRGSAQTPMTVGALMPLNLSLDNPNEFALTIDNITVTVLDVEAPRADADHPCSAVDFEVRHLKGRVGLTLAADSNDNLSELLVPLGSWPAVGMLNRPVNQDGCKESLLTLGYEASGVRVRR